MKKNQKNLNRLVNFTSVMWILFAALMIHYCATEHFGYAFACFGAAALWFTAFINFADIREDYENEKKN